ncbi:MAG: hypothetical protein WCI27_06565 [Candidatus Omnitrophota bacterium]
MLRNFLLTVFVIILSLLGSEIVLFYTGADIAVLRKFLYFQRAEIQLFQPSRNADRLYELKPGVSFEFDHVSSKETKYSDRLVSVNGLGFRGKTLLKIKPKGVFRIAVFGGSNTQGALVSDNDTYPADMQKIFDKIYPGKVEVWNAGLYAYVLSQDIAYAEYFINEFDPDLIIIQHTNEGRRPFLFGSKLAGLKYLFHHNRDLYKENTPAFFNMDQPWQIEFHSLLSSYSGVYRTVCVGIYSLRFLWKKPSPQDLFNPKGFNWNNYYAQQNSEYMLNVFLKKYKRIPVVMFYVVGCSRILDVPAAKFVLDPSALPEEYHDIHPPSYVYEWYAQKICEFLVKNKFLYLKE